ncbi:unnamed protein product [Didymodactylos carnosus]|uniref:Uncharacterized protein n=1 Tax=Didymodactylos carnosus TaxID=1234261 RepID=A0A8S2EGG8_9BILA|nr:unnamed protein product [Didymodactylos carnosus]CAF4026298.1 unnamed protein product [Didymodactylos carnosus]
MDHIKTVFKHNHHHNSWSQQTLDSPNTAYLQSYAIVVSTETNSDDDWKQVVDVLHEKHPNATVYLYRNDVTSVKEALQISMPRYTAFVCKPSECGREFVASVHRLTRTLDDEPYIDTMWAIITGSDAKSALNSIKDDVEQPFIIRTALNFTNVDQDLFDMCFTFSDSKYSCWYGKNCCENGKEEGSEYSKPPALMFSEKLDAIRPDLLVTGGHGTEHTLEMPWTTGMLYATDQSLLLLDTEGNAVASPIETSPNPKVFLPIANCLIGHCVGENCMVTLFMGKLGVKQLCGYTVNTWFGRAGWGTLDLWKSIPGQLALSQAYFLNQVRMTYDLKSINSHLLKFKFDVTKNDPSYESVGEQINNCFKLSDNIDAETREKIYGLCYDRDTTVLYGDPAFDARFDKTKCDPILSTKFIRTSVNTHSFIITFTDTESISKLYLPVGVMFTSRIANYNIISGIDHEPILSDNFIMVLKPRPKEGSTTVVIDFRGTVLP